MARTFNGTSDVITCTMSTGVANWLFGTMVAVVKRANDTNWNGPMCRVQVGGTTPESFLDIAPTAHATNNALWCDFGASSATASNTPKVLSADGWVLVAAAKATGSVAPVYHYYVFNTGVWTRVTGTAQGDSIGATGGTITLGNTVGDFFAGDIDVLAFFPTALNNTQMDTLVTSLSAWDALTPTAMWVLDQASTATAVQDRTGNGANQSSISGTSIASTSSPLTIASSVGWSFLSNRPGLGPPSLGTFLARPLSATSATSVQISSVATISSVTSVSTAVASKKAAAGTIAAAIIIGTSVAKKVVARQSTTPVVLAATATIKKAAPAVTNTPTVLTATSTIKKAAPTATNTPTVLVSTPTIKKLAPAVTNTPTVLVSTSSIKKLAPAATIAPVILVSWRDTSGVVAKAVATLASVVCTSTARGSKLAPTKTLGPVVLLTSGPVRKTALSITSAPVVLVGRNAVTKRALSITSSPVTAISTIAERKIAKALILTSTLATSSGLIQKRSSSGTVAYTVLSSAASITLFFRDLEVDFSDVTLKWFIGHLELEWDLTDAELKWAFGGLTT